MKVPSLITSHLAEETGWHIGDGSMNFYKHKDGIKGFYQLRGHIEEDKSHYERRIRSIFKELYDIDISLRTMPKTRVFGFQLWNSQLVRFKQGLGLPLGKKTDIIIPDSFLQGDELKKSIVRGIFDTDGGIYLEPKNNKLYPNLSITTISKELADQLHRILNEFSIRTTKFLMKYPNDKSGFNRQPCYRVITRGIEMFDNFMKTIQPANPKHIEKYMKLKNFKKL